MLRAIKYKQHGNDILEKKSASQYVCIDLANSKSKACYIYSLFIFKSLTFVKWSQKV